MAKSDYQAKPSQISVMLAAVVVWFFGPPFESRLKYLNNYQTDFHEILYRLAWMKGG